MMSPLRFQRQNLRAAPWKNGGGTTREIAVSDPETPYWRLSIADVDQDGPFSPFPGLSRVLTVIEGEGMTLHGAEKTLDAGYLQPVSFSGGENIDGKLSNGPIKDLNLIYDSRCWQAQVLAGEFQAIRKKLWDRCDHSLIYCLSGFVATKSDGFLKAHQGVLDIQSADLSASGSSGICIWVALRKD